MSFEISLPPFLLKYATVNCSWIWFSGSDTAIPRHEQEKKRAYNQRVLEVENGMLTPLVFSTSSGIGREDSEFYKRLADRLSVKRDKPYSMTMGWLRCCLNFALLHSAILCIRGSRSSKHNPFQDTNIELMSKEGRLEHESIIE